MAEEKQPISLRARILAGVLGVVAAAIAFLPIKRGATLSPEALDTNLNDPKTTAPSQVNPTKKTPAELEASPSASPTSEENVPTADPSAQAANRAPSTPKQQAPEGPTAQATEAEQEKKRAQAKRQAENEAWLASTPVHPDSQLPTFAASHATDITSMNIPEYQSMMEEDLDIAEDILNLAFTSLMEAHHKEKYPVGHVRNTLQGMEDSIVLPLFFMQQHQTHFLTHTIDLPEDRPEHLLPYEQGTYYLVHWGMGHLSAHFFPGPALEAPPVELDPHTTLPTLAELGSALRAAREQVAIHPNAKPPLVEIQSPHYQAALTSYAQNTASHLFYGPEGQLYHIISPFTSQQYDALSKVLTSATNRDGTDLPYGVVDVARMQQIVSLHEEEATYNIARLRTVDRFLSSAAFALVELAENTWPFASPKPEATMQDRGHANAVDSPRESELDICAFMQAYGLDHLDMELNSPSRDRAAIRIVMLEEGRLGGHYLSRADILRSEIESSADTITPSVQNEQGPKQSSRHARIPDSFQHLPKEEQHTGHNERHTGHPTIVINGSAERNATYLAIKELEKAAEASATCLPGEEAARFQPELAQHGLTAAQTASPTLQIIDLATLPEEVAQRIQRGLEIGQGSLVAESRDEHGKPCDRLYYQTTEGTILMTTLPRAERAVPDRPITW